MKLNQSVIYWEPRTMGLAPIRIVEKSSEELAMSYRLSGGSLYSCVRELQSDSAKAQKEACRLALVCIIRDGLDPKVVHNEFLKIDEYAIGFKERNEKSN